MISVYLMNEEQLGDRNFNEIPVADLQLELEPITLEEFQTRFNLGAVNPSVQFVKFVSI